MSPVELTILTAYYAVLTLLTIYSAHRFYLVRLRAKHPGVRPVTNPASWPSVTVQLPVYNEPNVVARLIDSVAALEYPGELDIQLLDDSTDETTLIAASCIAAWTERGVRIAHLRRAERSGYKAGALACGMAQSDSELFAIFDADFVPPPDFLIRAVPHMTDPSVGMVQARWEHLNRYTSLLTRVQAIFLDAHFAVESAARNVAGRFFNFNGTAGIWRRKAIEDGGGWSSSTLTEDLDLSYRAQLAGWRFVFLNEVTTPAELPDSLSGFQEQQYRWAKGSIQTARKLVVRIIRSSQPLRVKLEALFHLTNNCAYLLGVILALLLPPAMWVRGGRAASPLLIADALLFTISSGSVLLFYAAGQRCAGNRPLTLRELIAVLPVGVGIGVRNSAAVVSGAIENGGYFTRTPKRGDGRGSYENRARVPWSEALLLMYFYGAAVLFIVNGYWTALPFLALFLSGYAYVVFHSVPRTGQRELLSFFSGRMLWQNAPSEPRRHAARSESDRRSPDADRARRTATERKAIRVDAGRPEIHRRKRPRSIPLETDRRPVHQPSAH